MTEEEIDRILDEDLWWECYEDALRSTPPEEDDDTPRDDRY